MDLQALLKSLQDCPCGREHHTKIKAVEIGEGLVKKAGKILAENKFPKNILVVGDGNSMRVTNGILDVIKEAGFECTTLIYDDMRFARMESVEELESLAKGHDGILSIGTGSVNDICRLTAYRRGVPLAIFATAPSMDGFASDTAPITKNNYKKSEQAASPWVIMADTNILAQSPAVLKSAGLGDLLAKYIAMVDWRASTLLTGEWYCDRVANITRTAVRKAVALADKVTGNSTETAEAIMEALVLTGIAMEFTGNSRPASGSEHIVSHFWEIMKLEKGIWPDFHGKKVGVATLMVAKIYKDLAKLPSINPRKANVDWDHVKKVYGNFAGEVTKCNNPPLTDKIDLEFLKNNWGKVVDIINEELPDIDELERIMKISACATTPEEVNVTPEMVYNALHYSPYMRNRFTVLRIRDILGIDY
ncbi:MAG: sn-glycerol-1-phosphate dehydrogenase [Bacillota bacterium]|nr:sn-glycerol-1-phosphate dehydrogenase [Bacillota bacterium]